MSIFSFRRNGAAPDMAENAVDEIFPLSLAVKVFTKADIQATFSKILTDTFERTHGLDQKQKPLLWDNCVQSNTATGLVTYLAHAMTEQRDLYLIYKPSLNVLREADSKEKSQIEADYKKDGESKNGVYISFKKYKRSEMLQIYSELEYCVLSSLHKSLNISKAVQIKLAKLRDTTSLADAEVPRIQARSIANALRSGKDVYMDAADVVDTAKPDTSTAEKAITFLAGKKAFILGLPLAYVVGEQTGGLGVTGEADMRAIERGLKQYFVSIVEPVVLALFDKKVEFRSEDFRNFESGLEMLKTFDLVGDDIISHKAKVAISQRVFDLDPKEEEKAKGVEEEEAEEKLKNNPPPQEPASSRPFFGSR